MSANKSIISWEEGDSAGKARAFEEFAETPDAYTGVSKAYHRDFLDIEPNRSVRPSFSHNDYYAFRPDEEVPRKQKRIIKMCMDAYDKVGIVRNVIDLMGDFGCQGISIVHENKSVEKLLNQWFKKVHGKDRSERFLNNLYRTGNVFVYKSYAQMTPEISQFLKSIATHDINLEVPNIEKNTIPWRYNFLNPMTIDHKDGDVNMFIGRRDYSLDTGTFLENFTDGNIPDRVLQTLPPNIKRAFNEGKRQVPLDLSRLHVSYYKKDDWQQWAHPLIYAILDDIVMLEKMKLADLSALDGAISNIRLWTMGDFDHKVLPTKEGINKLRNILASNVGGGTMELVWGPELRYTESNSQVYKFLGSEKYQSVLNSIYAGLGVPPTLTGMAGNGGGFTNNFISLKTLVERLQYGRDQLTRFWETELEYIRKSMGFRKPAHVVYDQMSLSDEAAEKNLLIQLADRDIISHETVLERFKEVAPVEKVRLKREQKDRGNDEYPDKASPYHNANHKQDMQKIEKQGEINRRTQEKKQKENKDSGRPPFSPDEGPRKKRVDTPKNKPGVAEMFTWTSNAFDSLSSVNKAYLGVKGKSNMRQLTKADIIELENLKLDVVANLTPLSSIDDESIHKALSSNKKAPQKLKNSLSDAGISIDSMTADLYKKSVVGKFVEYYFTQN